MNLLRVTVKKRQRHLSIKRKRKRKGISGGRHPVFYFYFIFMAKDGDVP
jgi:hypothetical protein